MQTRESWVLRAMCEQEQTGLAGELHAAFLAEDQWVPSTHTCIALWSTICLLVGVLEFLLSKQCFHEVVCHPKGIIRTPWVQERDHWSLRNDSSYPFTAGELLCCEIEFQLDIKLISFHSSNFCLRHCVSVFGTCCVWAWKPTPCICVASWCHQLSAECHAEQGDWRADSFPSATLAFLLD
jgi:hypothetical protein